MYLTISIIIIIIDRECVNRTHTTRQAHLHAIDMTAHQIETMLPPYTRGNSIQQ